VEEYIPKMIFEACSNSFSGEIASALESKKEMIRYRKEESERCARELAEKQNKQRIEMESRKSAFLKGISDHAKRWFEYEHLSKYADELEAFSETIVDEKQAKLLYEYIRLVRQNAKEYNPIAYLLSEMEQISQG